jgi:hypothetical protein
MTERLFERLEFSIYLSFELELEVLLQYLATAIKTQPYGVGKFRFAGQK